MNELPERDVLCIDPSADYLSELSGLLSSNNFVPHAVTRIGDALELAASRKFGVILMEYFLGNTQAVDAIRLLHKLSPQSAIILLSEGRDRRRTGDRRLGLAFEFLEKPAPPEILLPTVNRAWSYYLEKQSLFSEYENEERMKYQLEWLLWKGHARIQEKVEFTGQIIDSIRHSLTQGMGIGSLVTLGELLQMDRKPEGDRYTVSKRIVDSLVSSAQLMDSWLVFLTNLSSDIREQHKAELMTGAELMNVIHTTAEEMSPYREIKGHKLEWDPGMLALEIFAHKEVLKFALRELLINSFKYSPDGSTVSILTYRAGNQFALAVVNDILPMTGGITGIPVEMENQVFEPFFKANNHYDERFGRGSYGLGVGLTLVQKALFEIGGRIFLHEITDYSALNQGKRIIAEMLLPVGTYQSQQASADGQFCGRCVQTPRSQDRLAG